jgi:hypothetical protein
MSEHLSDLVLDALRIGSPEVSAAEREHAAGCPRCQDRGEALAREAAAFTQRFEPAGLAAEALERAARRTSARRWWPALVPVFAAAAAAAIAVVVAKPELRSKGDQELVELYVLDGERRELMSGPVAKDARLAVRIAPERPRLVRILWGSAPGRWAALYPQAEAGPWAVLAPSWLEREVILDGAPEPERLAVVACEQTVDHAAAVKMLESKVRSDCTIAEVRVIKR